MPSKILKKKPARKAVVKRTRKTTKRPLKLRSIFGRSGGFVKVPKLSKRKRKYLPLIIVMLVVAGIGLATLLTSFAAVNLNLLGGSGGSSSYVCKPVSNNVFVRGDDGGLWWREWTPSKKWSGWRNLGGRLASAPAASSSKGSSPCADVITVAARGTDNKVWIRQMVKGSWKDWFSIGGLTNATPGVYLYAADHQTIVVRGMDNRLYINSGGIGPSTWTKGWHKVDNQTVGSGPAVFVLPMTHEVVIAFRANDGTLQECMLLEESDQECHSMEYYEGQIRGEPAFGLNGSRIVARGTNDQVWVHDPDIGWNSIGGGTHDSPAISAWGGDDYYGYDVWVRGTDNKLWHKWYSYGLWHEWENLEGGLTSAPAAAVRHQ